jgi:hypothetical protein
MDVFIILCVFKCILEHIGVQMILTDQQLLAIKESYENGKTYPKIAADLRLDGVTISDETIRKYLKKMGVSMRESRESLAAPVNSLFFDVIDCELKAYWLGFLVADACIGKSAESRRSLRFYLAAKDEQAIRQFIQDIDYKGKIREPDVSRGQFGVCFNNEHLCGRLIEIGYLDWKSNGNPKLFEFIPNELKRHFIRGFFDGDGCISGRKKRLKSGQDRISYYFNFVANKNHTDVMNALERYVSESVDLPLKGVKVRSTCVSFGWNGNKQVERFGRWLYRGATRYLRRKFDGFQALIRQADTLNFEDIALKQVPIEEYKPFLDKHHYLGCGGRRGYAVGAYFNGQLIAAAIIGSITRAEMAVKQGHDPNVVRELARLCIHPDYHIKNLPTWFLSRVVKRFAAEFPDIRLLISFADTTQGHEGTIYKAGNWTFDGFTGKSHHYLDKAGTIIHKKTVYDLAKKTGMTEKQYVMSNGLIKVPHKKKKRFILPLTKSY